MVIGMTKWEGSHSPCLPQIEIEPFLILSKIVAEIKSSYSLQILLFSNNILGGSWES